MRRDPMAVECEEIWMRKRAAIRARRRYDDDGVAGGQGRSRSSIDASTRWFAIGMVGMALTILAALVMA